MKNELKDRFLNSGLTAEQSEACLGVLDQLCEQKHINLDYGVEILIHSIHGGMLITKEEAHERLMNYMKNFPEYDNRTGK